MKSNTLLILIFSFAISGLSQASDITKPNLSETYQGNFQAAWNKATEGELPVYECGGVINTATKMVSQGKDVNNEAQQAYKACYVDAFLHYTNAFFALRNNTELAEDNKPIGCELYSRYIKTHITSLVTYAERFNLNTDDLNSQLSENLSATASLCEIEIN